MYKAKNNVAFSKRVIAAIVVVVLMFSMVGCSDGGKGKTASETGNNVNESSAIEMYVPVPESEYSIDKAILSDEQGQNTTDGSALILITDDTFKDDESDDEVSRSIDSIYEDEEDSYSLTPTQLNSVNMLNYMTALTQQVTINKKDQLFLESVYNSFDNLYPNSVDSKTQAQISSLMDTINTYRMISVKRARLEYIYEQSRAQALRQAIPNPMGLLSAVQSGSILKAAASVLYMAIDSSLNYRAASSQTDLQFVKDGWELNDKESEELHNSTKQALNYLFEMVRTYEIPGDYALSRSAVEDFIRNSSNLESQLVSKTSWLESHRSAYEKYGPYWLTLVKCYYASGDYKQCLNAITQYENINTRIFRKNLDYAEVLPMIIISARESMKEADYIETAKKYCELILSNSVDANWSIRYFTAQIYMDLYSKTNDSAYLEKAYNIVFDNMNELAAMQRNMNSAYLEPVKDEPAGKDATKREKEEIKRYNNLIKKERKIAVPPASEALYLNCELLFSLVDKLGKDAREKKKIESILHENGTPLFLATALDNRFWFSKRNELSAEKMKISFDGKKLMIPASCVTDLGYIVVSISSENGGRNIDDWIVSEVKRPQNADYSEFEVIYESKKAKEYKYKAGDIITIKVFPLKEAANINLIFKYKAVKAENFHLFCGIGFERINNQ